MDSPICGITTLVAIQLPALHVYGGPVRRVGRLPHRFRHRRVRMDRANELLDRALETERKSRFRDEFRRAQSDHVDAENLIVLPIGDYLDEPFRFRCDARAPEHTE